MSIEEIKLFLWENRIWLFGSGLVTATILSIAKYTISKFKNLNEFLFNSAKGYFRRRSTTVDIISGITGDARATIELEFVSNINGLDRISHYAWSTGKFARPAVHGATVIDTIDHLGIPNWTFVLDKHLNKGESIKLVFDLYFKDSFKNELEYYSEVYKTRVDNSSIVIKFPHDRIYQKISAFSESDTRMEIRNSLIVSSSDGRKIAALNLKTPKKYVKYAIEWAW